MQLDWGLGTITGLLYSDLTMLFLWWGCSIFRFLLDLVYWLFTSIQSLNCPRLLVAPTFYSIDGLGVGLLTFFLCSSALPFPSR